VLKPRRQYDVVAAVQLVEATGQGLREFAEDNGLSFSGVHRWVSAVKDKQWANLGQVSPESAEKLAKVEWGLVKPIRDELEKMPTEIRCGVLSRLDFSPDAPKLLSLQLREFVLEALSGRVVIDGKEVYVEG